MYNLYKEYLESEETDLEYFDWLDNQILLRSRDRKLEEANKKYTFITYNSPGWQRSYAVTPGCYKFTSITFMAQTYNPFPRWFW